MVGRRPLARPTAITTIPATAAANPSTTPVWPRASFTGVQRWPGGGEPAHRSSFGPVRRGDPTRMGGDVGRGVLHQYLVGDERRPGEVADGDDRDVLLEELGRAPGVGH